MYLFIYFYYFWCFLFLFVDSKFHLYHISSIKHLTFNISYGIGQLLMRSSRFVVSENVFILPPVLKNNFIRYRNPGGQFFFFSVFTALKTWLYYLVFWIVSDWKSYICSSVFNILFSLAACKTFSRLWFSAVWLWCV